MFRRLNHRNCHTSLKKAVFAGFSRECYHFCGDEPRKRAWFCCDSTNHYSALFINDYRWLSRAFSVSKVLRTKLRREAMLGRRGKSCRTQVLQNVISERNAKLPCFIVEFGIAIEGFDIDQIFAYEASRHLTKGKIPNRNFWKT